MQASEFQRWLPGARVVLYDGTPEERRVLQRDVEARDFMVLLTHYDLAMRDRAALRKVGCLFPPGVPMLYGCWPPQVPACFRDRVDASSIAPPS